MLDFIRILIITSAVIGGFFFLLTIVYMLIGRDVCNFLGHDWEHISYDTIQRKNGDVEVWEVNKCRNCKKIQKAHYIYHTPEEDEE